MKRNKPISTLVHKHEKKTIKVRKERCNHKITLRRVIKEKTKILSEKPHCGPPSWNDPLVNKVGVQGYQKDPPSLIYPLYLNPPNSSYQLTSPSHFFTNYPDPAISSKLHLPINGFFQYFTHAPKLLLTLILGEVFGQRTSQGFVIREVRVEEN